MAFICLLVILIPYCMNGLINVFAKNPTAPFDSHISLTSMLKMVFWQASPFIAVLNACIAGTLRGLSGSKHCDINAVGLAGSISVSIMLIPSPISFHRALKFGSMDTLRMKSSMNTSAWNLLPTCFPEAQSNATDAAFFNILELVFSLSQYCFKDMPLLFASATITFISCILNRVFTAPNSPRKSSLRARLLTLFESMSAFCLLPTFSSTLESRPTPLSFP